MCMGSDYFFLYSESSSRGISTKRLLLKELQKVKEKLSFTPHPYCEPDCLWLSICRRSLPPGCILNDLIDPNLWC